MSATSFGFNAERVHEEVAELATEIHGLLLVPGEEGYAAESSAYNLNNPLEPALVVGAANTADVQAAVRFAAGHNRPVAVRATGHQVIRSTREAVLINTSRLNGVHVDAVNRIVRVEAGVRWHEVVEKAAEYGLAPLNGSSLDVGVIGYILGGGQGPVLSRSQGYASEHVQMIEVVTADGELRKVTADSEPDLFWALRGGKGNFGVVTALEMCLFPVTEFYGGGLYFAGEQMAEVLHVWRTWAAGLPEEATTSVAVQRLPALPELPEPLRGAFVLHVRFAHLGPASEGEALIAPIRAVTTPLLDAVTKMPYTSVGMIHMDPPQPMPYYDRTTALRELSAETMDAFIELTGPGSDCPLASVEIRALGGALDREPAVPDAVPTRGIPFIVFAAGVGGPDQAGLLQGYLDRIMRRLAPWAVEGNRMVNFLSADEATTAEELRLVYGAERYRRLAEIKKAYDPLNVFRVNHNIVPA
ncbi:FAD/FMN-containing dehydrogenase [Microbispora rosea]|uniref:FAD/FMN-containing dehydrogenase n=1 Tax=Microbispora rosea TaxID=58117 RepID=A0A1N7HAA2_9ACTN|nr:oxidoreductase [Microbispora rosea subsp. rosea]SIS21797.1 FAD/FMN-containing dehydrogenase [Microbispora rosea]